MAEILTDYLKPRKSHANDFQHDTYKRSTSKHNLDRQGREHGHASNHKLVPNHDLIGVQKPNRKSKDLEKAFAFIHGEHLFPLDQETAKKPVPSKRKSVSEKKARDLVVLETRAETEIKLREPKIHEPKQRRKNVERISPLKDVKRKLDFGENDQELGDRGSNGLDFTDKIAALRSLLDTGFKTSLPPKIKDTGHSAGISNDARPFGGTDQHVRKVAHITRNDSLKENELNMIELAAKRRKRREDAKLRKEDKHNEDLGTSERKEEIENDRLNPRLCDSMITKDRLSALTVDLHTLKDRLFERRKSKVVERNSGVVDDKYLDKFIAKRPKVIDKKLDSPKMLQEFDVGDALDHLSPDRKVLTSSKKSKLETGTSEKGEDNIKVKSKSNLDSKEIQTDVLNHSMRSVQSNVPFYDPHTGFGEPVKRPSSTHSQSSVRKKLSLINNVQNINDGICEAITVPDDNKQMELSSPSHAKQTNVDSFVGSSLTPEKKRNIHVETTSPKFKNHKGLIKTFEEDINLNNAQKPEDNHEYILTEKDVATESLKQKNDADRKLGSEKSNSNNVEREKKIEGYKQLKCNLRKQETDTNDREKIRNLGSIGIDKLHSEDEFLDDNFAQRILENTKKTEKKVREWIESQEKVDNFYPADSGPMILEELSVSPSVESKTKSSKLVSPSDSCDKYPVKLEKWENEREKKSKHTAMQKHPKRVLPETPIGRGLGTLRKDKGKIVLNGVDADFPMRDLLPSKPKHPHHTAESLESDTEKIQKKPFKRTRSSIFSLPFSVESGESVSTTFQAVKLLRRLYNVDVEKRQNLVLMARCFRRWLNNVLHMKEHNYKIQEAARVSPISYGVMIRKGEICYRTYILGRFFNKWKTARAQEKLHKAVMGLRRKHMLQKGINAFKWAINRSKLRQGILQDRVNGILLQATFVKWKSRAEENRRCRLQHAFARWRQFTKEAQKMCMLRNQTNQKLKQRVFLLWCRRYEMRQKQHKADAHFRMVLISQGLTSWKLFTVISKEKKLRVKLAIGMYESKLQRQTFCQMKIELEKYRRAKTNHRTSQLRQALRAWKAGSAISKGERQNDMRVAIVCWSRTTLRSHFLAWHDALLTRRACRMSDRHITQHTFSTWRHRYQQLLQQRKTVDTYYRQKLMFRALKQWYLCVVVTKKKRAVAIEYIESVLQRQMLHVWHGYTVYQKDLRKRLQLNLRKKNLQVQKKFLVIWKSHFKLRLDKHHAQQLWSSSCVKRAADKWQMICHRRSLDRLLVDTEPVRQLNTLRVFFIKWKAALGLVETEKQEASDIRTILDLSQLRRCYDIWKAGTQQLLTIKPMVMRYRQKLVTMCFESWLELVRHKRECKRSQEQFERIQLGKKFQDWRKQYLAHQREKEFNRKVLLNQVGRCLRGWRFVIKRKHLAVEFHNKQLVQNSFYYWNTLTGRQLRQKQMEKYEYETEMSIKREYFDRWRQRLYSQQTHAEEVVTSLRQQQDNNRLRSMFNFWRRHFRATLVARENEKIRIRRLSKQALQAWHKVSQSSLQEAVTRFATAIGLHQGSGDTNVNSDGTELDNQDGLEETEDVDLEPMNPTLAMVQYSPRTSRPHSPRLSRTPRTPKTPRTPRHASSCGTPLRRLFSPTLSHQSLAQSLEFESAAMMSSSFLDARFEMEHAVKTESRREIVTTVVSRLRHWPLSIIFDQWKEYTARQQEFKSLTTQMIGVQEKLAVCRYFNSWVKMYHAMKLAKQHYDQVLQHKALLSLVLYRNSRKEKKHLAEVARMHYTVRVYNKVFPMWSLKAQEKHQREHIVHLWTNITPEEQQLIPRERSFRYQLNRKSLTLCYRKWKSLYSKIAKLKKVYHRILLERYFNSWCTWALERHERHQKSREFAERRTTTLAFKTWCVRYTQKTEVARRYEDTWHNYLGLIITTWSRWAKDQRRHCRLATVVSQRQDTILLFDMFHKWKQETSKQIQVKQWYENRLTIRTLLSWQSIAAWQKISREKVLYFRLKCYTKLAKQTFRRWHGCYLQKQQEHREHKRRLEQKILQIARIWRCKAQETRGVVLQAQIENRHLQNFFNKWKSAHYKNMDRVSQLQTYLDHKNGSLLRDCLETWRTALMGIQAERVFNMRLVAAYIWEWNLAAKACKYREENLLNYRQSRQQHTQKGYFLYWYNIAKARQSIRGHANLKIQLSTFKAWLVYTRKSINLRRLEKAVTRRRNQKILQNYWYTMKTRFHYCEELTHMAERVIREKHENLMRQALEHWDFRLKIVIAGECFHHLLAKRVARRWRNFVSRKREERRLEAELMLKAKNFHDRKLCNIVFVAWHNEVLVTRQIVRHKARIEVKYGRIWKHKVDMMYTAKCVRRENQLAKAWNKWHMAFARQKAVRKVEAFQRRQTLSTVLVAWKTLCKKRRTRVSMIPLPVSPAFNMPSAGTSSSSTPTDEVLSSPTFELSAKPATRRSKLPSYSGRSSGNNGENGGSRAYSGRRSSAM